MRNHDPKSESATQHACFDVLDAVFADDATDEQFASLEQLLREDESVRVGAVRYLHLHALIERQTAESLPADEIANLAATVEVAANQSPVRAAAAWVQSTVSRPVVWSVLAAGILFAGYVAIISWGMFSRDRLPADGVSEDVVATIRESADVAWSADQSTIGNPKSEITASEPLRIRSGLVELQLKQGTTLLIEGPAEWTIDSENSATLSRGRLVAKVPQQAVGFTLETPATRIVDLGTEFGAEVSGSGDVKVSVFRGTVETQSRQRNKQPLQLAAGQSARIEAGTYRVESIPFADSPFAQLRARDSNAPALNAPVVLFADNFDSPETLADISPTANSRHLRQSGVLHGLSYIEQRSDKRPNTPLDDRTSLIADEASGRLRLSAKRSSTVTVSPNANFRAEHRDGTRFVVECDVRPVDFADGGEHPKSDSWAGVIVGCPSQMSLVGDPGGISLLIRRDGRYTVFDGTAGKSTVAVSGAVPAESVSANGIFHVRLEYDVARFGGPQPAEVRININNLKVAQFTSQRSLLENYIVLQSFTNDQPISSDFDNLSISEQELPIRESVNSK